MDGQTNMDRDRQLLSLAEEGGAYARVYSWTGAWVSLGMSQVADRELLDPNLVPWVVRPTGGKAVLHGHDATLGLAVNLELLGVGARALRSAYRAIIAPLTHALTSCGLPCTLAEETRFVHRGVRTADCFAHTSANDVVNPVSGQKICGCALRMTDRAVLVQASIPCGIPLADPQRLFARPNLATAPRWNVEGFPAALEDALQETAWFPAGYHGKPIGV